MINKRATAKQILEQASQNDYLDELIEAVEEYVEAMVMDPNAWDPVVEQRVEVYVPAGCYWQDGTADIN